MGLRDNAAFWNERSKIFDTQVAGIYEDAYAKTIEGARRYIKTGGRVLDIGCGTGIVTFPMAEKAGEVVAVDTSGDMLKKALQKKEERQAENVRFLHGDMYLEELSGEQFDAVTVFNVLLYIEDRKRAFERIASLLQPGGCFISATDCLGFSLSKDAVKKWFKTHTGRMPYVAFFTAKALEEEIKTSGFHVLEGRSLFKNPVNYFIAAEKRAD